MLKPDAFPVPGPLFDLFICHASSDGAAAAQAVVKDLEKRGLRCWIAPRDIPPGVTWPSAIVAGIEASLAMLLVVSTGANASQEIEKEVTLAAHMRKPILPARLVNIPLSGTLLYHLQNRQWRDLFADREQVLDEIVGQVRLLRGSAAPAAVAPQAPRAATSRRPRAMLAGAALLVVLAAAGVGWSLLSGNGPWPFGRSSGMPGRSVRPFVAALLADGAFHCTSLALPENKLLTTDYCYESGKAYTVRFAGAPAGQTFQVTNVLETNGSSGSTILEYADPGRLGPQPKPADLHFRAPIGGEPVAVLMFENASNGTLTAVDKDCAVVEAQYRPPAGGAGPWPSPASLFQYRCRTPMGTAAAPILSTRGDLIGIVYGNAADGLDVGRKATALVETSGFLTKLYAADDPSRTP